jgi:hypothetical protein
MTEKLYCYVDETGQDTRGDLYIVSVVVADNERDRSIELCEAMERESGKGRIKWVKADYAKRLDYIRRVLHEPTFKGKLNFAVYRNSLDYLPLTVLTIARTIVARGQRTYKATVLIDGLPRSHERWVGSELRHLRIQIKKVRGVRKDENDALIRLADAVCGFVRAALEGQAEMKALFEQGKQSSFLKEL